jgi:hypothetical protein
MTTSAVHSPWGQIVNDLTTASYSTFDYQPTFQLPTEKNIVFSSGDSEMLKISPKGFWVRGVQVNQDAKEAATVYEAFKQWLVWSELNRS